MKSRETNTIVANAKKSSKKHVLFKNIKNHIGMNSLIMTDEAPGYKPIPEIDYGNWNHLTINHSEGKYGEKVVHRLTGEVVNISTNGIEGFCSVFKRDVKGTYIHISKKHMQNYVNEFVYGYNYKDSNLFLRS